MVDKEETNCIFEEVCLSACEKLQPLMLTKVNPFWSSPWPFTSSFFCFLWLLETAGPGLGKAFSVAHKGPAFLLPPSAGLESTAGSAPVQRSRWQWTAGLLPEQVVSVYPSATRLPCQAFKLLKFRFSLWIQTLNKLIHCCSTDCKISRFTVAKRRRRRKKKNWELSLPLW